MEVERPPGRTCPTPTGYSSGVRVWTRRQMTHKRRGYPGPPHWAHFRLQDRDKFNEFVAAAGALGLIAVRHRPPMIWNVSTPILGRWLAVLPHVSMLDPLNPNEKAKGAILPTGGYGLTQSLLAGAVWQRPPFGLDSGLYEVSVPSQIQRFVATKKAIDSRELAASLLPDSKVAGGREAAGRRRVGESVSRLKTRRKLFLTFFKVFVNDFRADYSFAGKAS